MSKKKEKKSKVAPVPRQVYQLKLVIDDEVKFEKAVEVRRPSELNGIANNYKAKVGQTIVWTATREV